MNSFKTEINHTL